MRNLYWLTEAQRQRLRPYFPESRGHARVTDLRVRSSIIFIYRNRVHDVSGRSCLMKRPVDVSSGMNGRRPSTLVRCTCRVSAAEDTV